MADIAKMVDELSGFTVMEVADLVKQLEAKWGVTAAAPVMAAPSGGGGDRTEGRVGRGEGREDVRGGI